MIQQDQSSEDRLRGGVQTTFVLRPAIMSTPPPPPTREEQHTQTRADINTGEGFQRSGQLTPFGGGSSFTGPARGLYAPTPSQLKLVHTPARTNRHTHSSFLPPLPPSTAIEYPGAPHGVCTFCDGS